MGIFVVGVPGTGKSTWAVAQARQLALRFGAHVVCHDPTASYDYPFVRRHGRAAELSAALSSERQAGMVHCLDVGDGSEVLTFYAQYRQSQKQENHRPMILVIDEVVAYSRMSPNSIDPLLRRLWATRRHHLLGMVMTTQRPQNAHPLLYDIATDIVCFRVTSDASLKRLAESGVPRGVVDKLPTLPDYQFYQLKVGKGLVMPDGSVAPYGH